jgi:hypothetical protein
VDQLCDLRSGASVGHGEDTGASVLEVEVLVLELLAIDGFTTGALPIVRLLLCLRRLEDYVRCRG